MQYTDHHRKVLWHPTHRENLLMLRLNYNGSEQLPWEHLKFNQENYTLDNKQY